MPKIFYISKKCFTEQFYNWSCTCYKKLQLVTFVTHTKYLLQKNYNCNVAYTKSFFQTNFTTGYVCDMKYNVKYNNRRVCTSLIKKLHIFPTLPFIRASALIYIYVHLKYFYSIVVKITQCRKILFI